MYSFSVVYLFQFTHPVRGATYEAFLELKALWFQFTHPVRGATQQYQIGKVGGEFQFTHPVRGATRTIPQTSTRRTKFQFTHPVRGATGYAHSRGERGYRFNSRTPCGVRQPHREGGCERGEVSIHAPRAGCDFSLALESASSSLFQFTHPVRGATSSPSQRSRQVRSFNSRTPCGVRQRATRARVGAAPFQFTHPVRGATLRVQSLEP